MDEENIRDGIMKHLKKILALIAILLLFIFVYPKIRAFADVEALRQFVKGFGLLAPLVFGLVYVLAGLFFVPLSLFTVASGLIFGTFWGLAIVLIAATIAAAIAFIIARHFSHYVPKGKKGSLVGKFQKTVENRLQKSTFQTIFILRLLYLPYVILSYSAGLVKTCKFWPYLLATFLTNIVGSFVFVYLGDSLGKGLKALILPVVLIALSLLIPRIVKRFTEK